MTAAVGASRDSRLVTARNLLSLSIVVFLLTSMVLGAGPVHAEDGEEIRIVIEAELVEAVHPVTLYFTLTLSGESPKLLSGDGTFRVSRGLQGRVVGTGVLDFEEGLQFQGVAFVVPAGPPVGVFFTSGYGPPRQAEGGIILHPQAPSTVLLGPIPPNSEFFPGETLTFRGTALMIILLTCSPDC